MEIIFDIYVYLIEGLIGLFSYNYSNLLDILKPISLILSLFFVSLIVWSIVKFREIMKSMKGFTQREEAEITHEKSPELQRKALENWQKILERGRSLDENERKFAVIEADTLLDKILGMTGYDGENLGAKLKQVERGDIESLDDLWEAHKIRNRIAHEANFKLAPETSISALSRFEKALKELEYI